ncbi:protein Daple-like isoform X1 [Arapaima gigas]
MEDVTVTVSELLEEFLGSPLVAWVKTFEPLGSSSEDKLSVFMEFADGVFFHKIMTHIDPRPANQWVNKHVNNDINLRIQNLSTVIRHIKNYYQESLQQLIVMNLPDVLTISKDPLSGKSIEELKKLLLLILGCAVQCEQKEEFIERIKSLDIEMQAAIVTHIQEVTHNQENVLDMQWLGLAELSAEELDSVSRSMAFHLRKLIDERDDYAEVIVELTQERDYLLSQRQPPHGPQALNLEQPVGLLTKEERQHLAVELVDSKAKLRRSRQELEEKTEQLIDAKSEVERLDLEVQKLKQENMQLLAEARSSRAYRDEFDALRERAGRVDRLETELARCKERLHDVHFYKSRVEELREDNMTLLETKALLEEQLEGARGRCDRLHELEKENLQLRSKLRDTEMDRDADKKRIEELVEENMALEISQKQSINESVHLGWELEQLTKSSDASETHKSFGVELNESMSSRLLKLEKENQSLQSTIQEMRKTSLTLEEDRLQILELEKENHGLSQKLERLQMVLDQEKQTTEDIENMGNGLLKDSQKLQKTMAAVHADKDRQILELQQEKEHLNQTVASLRRMAPVDSEAHVEEVEKTRVLHQTISDMGSKIALLEAEKCIATRELEDLREQAERAEKLMQEMSLLQRGHEQLPKEVIALQEPQDQTESLEQDHRRLKKLTDTAENAVLRVKALEEENLELQVASARLSHIQAENSEREHECGELWTLRKKTEHLEVRCSNLGSENQRLQLCLEGKVAKVQELERELQEVEAECEKLNGEAEELRLTGRHLNSVEEAKRRVEQELGVSEKARKQLEKEARRLRQQLDVKEAVLDESSLRVANLEKESSALNKELDRLKEAAGRMKDLEWENKELQKQATIDKKTLATLREDLVNEKLKVQQQQNELEKLSHELEKIGLNREKLLQEEHSCVDSKYKILQTKIESTLKKTLEIREEKIQSLESRLEESSNLNQELRTELATLRRSLEALRQRQEEEAHAQSREQGQLSSGQEKWETECREATAELLKLKDRLIDIEKNNAALQTEKQLLKEQLRQLDLQNGHLNTQLLALQRQTTTLQEHNTSLHTQVAKLQVENSTLGSQRATLMAQSLAVQDQLRALESEAEMLRRQREETRVEHEGVLQDHERLLSVHERQAAEYELLISQHRALKGAHRALEQNHHNLEKKYAVLLSQKSAMEELEAALHKEREILGAEIQRNTLILEENQSLRGEMDWMKQAHEQLRKEYDSLHLQSKELKTSLNSAQLELNRWQARYDQLKEQHQHLDISLTKMDNHCELLTRLKGNLEEENHHLLSQVQMLSQQNQTLLERTMESKELYHEEQKQYIDKLNTLRRQKEKLEEKIMDQYKFYDPSPKKRSQWAGAKALAKLIKPKKDSSRERSRSASEVPLPATPPPDYPVVPSPLLPPPLPPRHPRHNLAAAGAPGFEERSSRSPVLTPTHTSRVNNSGSSKGRSLHRVTGSAGDGANGSEGLPLRVGSPSFSLSSPTHAPDSGSRPEHRFRADDGSARPHSADSVFVSSIHGNADYRLSSKEFGRISSSTSSPSNSRGSRERVLGHPASLTSDNVITLGHGSQGDVSANHPGHQMSLSHSSTLPYNTSLQKGGPHSTCRRPSSPGSEIVTLEEFLQESNAPSPPTVHTTTREDLMTEYFVRVGDACRSAPLRDGVKTPTSYVAPTVKAGPPGISGENRAPKLGQSVKPSVRQPEPGMSHTLPRRVGGGTGGSRRSSQYHGSPRTGTSNVNCTFSLTSTDHLRSSGLDGCQQQAGAPQTGAEQRQGDTVVRRMGAVNRERPLSAHLAGPSPPPEEMAYHSLDSRRLSYALPREEHDPSSSLPASPGSKDRRSSGAAGMSRAGLHSRRPVSQHRAEVAMVSPVRPVTTTNQEEMEQLGEMRQAESPVLKKQDRGGEVMTTEEHIKAAPGSPDPSGDPQTVWYEYGCV